MIRHRAYTPQPMLFNEIDRPRLVRLCAHLSGSFEAADDLAQETLVEAWRHVDRLVEPSGIWPWLTAIARNVCLRWRRTHATDAARHAHPADSVSALAAATADDDIEIELEREELVTFLDHALALLPADTRAVLVARYVENFPQSAIAEHLRLTEGAVEARLHRGKLMLRKLLSTNLRAEAESLGIVVPTTDGWHPTRIWCPFCGVHHLQATIDLSNNRLHFRCMGACIPSGTIVGGSPIALDHNLRSPKAILGRVLLSLHTHYEHATAAGGKPCPRCGTTMPMVRSTEEVMGYGGSLEMLCPNCGEADGATLWHLALDTPAAQRFWQRHPRIRALRFSEVEYAGSPAIVSGFESVDGSAQLPVLFDPHTFRVLRAGGEPC